MSLTGAVLAVRCAAVALGGVRDSKAPGGHPNDGMDEAVRAATEFAPPFSAAHVAAVVAAAVAVAGVIVTARRVRPAMRDARGEVVDPAGRVLGALALAHWLAYQAWWNIPARFELSSSLPLHVCDLAGLAAGLTLLTGVRWLAVLTYFWGLALCTQAFVTPTVGWGPTYTEYWTFWEAHTVAVGGAGYVVCVRNFRPTARDCALAYGALVVYTAVLLPLNLLTGWNYGYVGRSSPVSRTLLDALGPWPWRLLPMAGLAAGAMVALWLPWTLRGAEGRAAGGTLR